MNRARWKLGAAGRLSHRLPLLPYSSFSLFPSLHRTDFLRCLLNASGLREVCNLYREFRRVSNFRTGILSLLAIARLFITGVRSPGHAVNYSGRKASASARICDRLFGIEPFAHRQSTRKTNVIGTRSVPAYLQRPGFSSVSLRREYQRKER